MKLDSTFRHRNLWMGLAMLAVMLHHSAPAFDARLFPLIRRYGYAGVDIFVFASGIGCYYSLDKDPNSLRFLKRRLKKLGPTYLCFIVPWILWKMLTSPFPIGAIPGNLLGVESFVSWEHHFSWYISALILFYLLIPYMKQLTDHCQSITADLLWLLLFFLLNLPFWSTFHVNMIILSRLPILYVGVMYGKLGKKGTLITKKSVFLHLLAVGIGCTMAYCTKNEALEVLWGKGFYWYPFIFIVPGLCLCLSFAGDALKRRKPLAPLYSFLEKIGSHSFELYLVHIFLFEQLMPVLQLKCPNVSSGMLWLGSWCAIAPLCFLLDHVSALVMRLFTGIRPH